MAEWFYTTNKQQMGPVSHDELRQLANKGLLKPTDLVWKDGMNDWERASAQGLFTDDDTETADAPRTSTRSARLVEDEADERPRRRSRRDEDEDDDDDDRPRRRRRARRDEDGMPIGLKVGLIVGGVVMLLLVVGLGMYFLLRIGGGNGGQLAVGVGDFNGILGPNDLRDPVRGGPSRIYNVRMVQGRTYVIEMRSGQLDSFLRLEDSAFRQIAQDDDSGGGLNARIIYRCSRTDNYRVIATTFGPGQGAYTLSIREN